MTFIYGESGSGKTQISAEFLSFLLESKNVSPSTRSILDFAPNRIDTPNFSVGGRIADFCPKEVLLSDLKYIPHIGDFHTPRLSASTSEEVLKEFCHNYSLSTKIWNSFFSEPTKFVIVNDLSIHLHLGGLKQLNSLLKLGVTVLINSYYGKNLVSDYGSNISQRERLLVELIAKKLNSFQIVN